MCDIPPLYEIPPERLERLQKSLTILRTALGYTAAEYGKMIEVSRVTVNNVEHGKAALTRMYILALFAISQMEMECHHNVMTFWILVSLIAGKTPPGSVKERLTEAEQLELHDILDEARFKKGKKCGIKVAQQSVIEAYKNYISKV